MQHIVLEARSVFVKSGFFKLVRMVQAQCLGIDGVYGELDEEGAADWASHDVPRPVEDSVALAIPCHDVSRDGLYEEAIACVP